MNYSFNNFPLVLSKLKGQKVVWIESLMLWKYFDDQRFTSIMLMKVSVNESVDPVAYSVTVLGTLLSTKTTSKVFTVRAAFKPTEHERNFTWGLNWPRDPSFRKATGMWKYQNSFLNTFQCLDLQDLCLLYINVCIYNIYNISIIKFKFLSIFSFIFSWNLDIFDPFNS